MTAGLWSGRLVLQCRSDILIYHSVSIINTSLYYTGSIDFSIVPVSLSIVVTVHMCSTVLDNCLPAGASK